MTHLEMVVEAIDAVQDLDLETLVPEKAELIRNVMNGFMSEVNNLCAMVSEDVD